MDRWSLLVVALACLVCPTPVASASANQPPTAAAGLDQSVTVGTTVYLDAGGSMDTDGQIAATEWSIRAPNGSTLAPSCRTCRMPTFTPDATGRWAVTVTVTDDDAASASDTLYVSVGESRGPGISLGAPETTSPGEATPIIVDALADESPLHRVQVFHDGERVDRFEVAGNDALVVTNHTFDATGTEEVLAVTTDENGYTNTTTVSVDVVSGGGGGGPGSGSSNPVGSGGTRSATTAGTSNGGDGIDCWVGQVGGEVRSVGNCQNDRVVTMPDGERRLIDANRDGQLTVRAYNGVFDGDSTSVTASEYVSVDQYEVGQSGDGIIEADYNAITDDVESAAVQEKKQEEQIQEISQLVDSIRPSEKEANNAVETISSVETNAESPSDSSPDGTTSRDGNDGGASHSEQSRSSSESIANSSTDLNFGSSLMPSDPIDRFSSPVSTGGRDSTSSSSSDSDTSSDSNATSGSSNGSADTSSSPPGDADVPDSVIQRYY